MVCGPAGKDGWARGPVGCLGFLPTVNSEQIKDETTAQIRLAKGARNDFPADERKLRLNLTRRYLGHSFLFFLFSEDKQLRALGYNG